MSDINKDRSALYLGALLEHIPLKNIQKTFKEIEGISGLLETANQYASADQYQKGDKQLFVLSPFENLRKPLHKQTTNFKFKPQVLKLSDDFFPQKGNNSTPKDIKNLWKKFEIEFNRLAIQKNEKTRAETILSLLQKYAVTIPNPTSIHPEVSWYDYAKIKAGLAVCIYDYLGANNKIEIGNDEKPLLIIRADISGIQNFIYDIASKRASKNLKGRSFYVQLLMDTVLQLMLDEFELYQGNVMYASGGNFFLIAPNTNPIKAAFDESNINSLYYRISNAIFTEHQTRIAVVMGYKEVSAQMILEGNINKAITDLFEEEIDRNKKRKFAGLIANDYAAFFDEKTGDKGGDTLTDIITGEEIVKDESVELSDEGDEERKPIKLSTQAQIQLGQHLKRIDNIIVTRKPLEVNKKYIFNPCKLGIYYQIMIATKEVEKIFKSKLAGQKVLRIFNINTGNRINISPSYGTKNSELAFSLYGGNAIPRFEFDGYPKEDGEGEYTIRDTKDFNHLALNFSKNKDGKVKVGDFKRLGVLRMDIDNLGTIFKDNIPYPNFNKETGTKRSNLTFSYYAALSRNLDWFFKGYLNTLIDSKPEFKHNAQIIYSGGDDLFIVARWDIAIQLAEEIKKQFQKFTGNIANKKEQVTISGGVAVVTNKFPIIKAAELAGKAEKKAKGHKFKPTNEILKAFNLSKDKVKNDEFEKNSFSLLGVPLNWETEFPLVKAVKEEILEFIEPEDNKTKPEKVPRSLLSKIHAHHCMYVQYRKNITKGNLVNPQWIWNVIYDFSRLIGRQKKEHQKKQNYLKRLKETTDKGNKAALKHQMERLKAKQKDDKELLNKIQKGIFTNSYEFNGKRFCIKSQYHFLELLDLAARWAELELRSKRN